MFIGREKEVLFETLSKDNPDYIEGYTDNYLKVLVPSNSVEEGELALVTLEELKEDFILGKKK